MPDKPVTVAAYAAGASLAAITLFYVFGPTFFIDGENSYNTSDARKRGIIGLSNPANDCFINSVLQALAGLGDLRLYLIRELHRRELDGHEIFESPPPTVKRGEKPARIVGLQKGPITKALKDMLDALNERPIYKKTISARPFIQSLEKAFQTRVSRNQQDAQEFFQIVAERLSDEYHAAEKARRRLPSNGESKRESQASGANQEGEDEREDLKLKPLISNAIMLNGKELLSTDEGFPFEGKLESQIQCQHCGFENKPTASTFVSLTLNVPQKSSTTLDNCFDILLKTEDIDDFKCDKCRLQHALEWKYWKLQQARSEQERLSLHDDIASIEKSIADDPEKPPEGIELPDSDQVPKRKIKKHMRITQFPKIIAIHLSRSVFDPRSYSTKNLAKVSYPERLRLGGILSEKWYKLLGIVCHKGSHNSGHYESFRRNHLYPPFATPAAFSAYAATSRNGSAVPSADPSPRIPAMEEVNQPSSPSCPSVSSASLSPALSRPASQGQHLTANGTPSQSLQPPRTASSTTSSLQSFLPSLVASPILGSDASASRPPVNVQESTSRFRRKKKSNDRWWRISDDKIKEARTDEVLSMQREVYLLFYELERPGDDAT